jgi:hypothetical protein
MTLEQRKRAAGEIRDGLLAHNVSLASIYSADALVVQVSGGKVLFVD